MLRSFKNAAVVVNFFLLVVFTLLLRHGCLDIWKISISNIRFENKRKQRLFTVTLVNKKSYILLVFFFLHHIFINFEYRQKLSYITTQWIYRIGLFRVYCLRREKAKTLVNPYSYYSEKNRKMAIFFTNANVIQ